MEKNIEDYIPIIPSCDHGSENSIRVKKAIEISEKY